MSPHRRRSSPHRAGWIIILIFSIIILSVFYLLSGVGPRTGGSGGAMRTVHEQAQSYMDQSVELEEEFDRITISKGTVTDADIELIERSIQYQREYISALPARSFPAERRLEQLQRKYSEYRGEQLIAQAQALEQEAAILEALDPDQALARLRDALQIRQQIQDRHGTSSAHDPAHMSRMQRRVVEMDVLPLHQRSLELENQAIEWEERGEFSRATELYAEAASIQENINRNYPRISLASPLRASQLRESETSVVAGQIKRQVDDLLEAGNEQVLNGQHQQASNSFARARELQRKLNLEFPRSSYASRTRETFLQVRQQNASAYEDYMNMLEMERAIRVSLYNRNFEEAALQLRTLSDRLNQFQLRYSRSTLPIEDIFEKTSYLIRKERNFRQISSAVESNLLPMPGTTGWKLMATEVPQYIYELVMDSNPSRSTGADSPVETVTIENVELFCKRLGWILARTTRIPTIEEFRQVAHPLQEENLAILSSSSNIDGTAPVSSREPDSRGFYHLMGNVSELVRSSPDSASFYHIGGNTRMSDAEILRLETSSMSAGERNRMVGFRIMVEDEMATSDLVTQPEV